MAYGNTVLNGQSPAFTRIDRLFQEINSLTDLELQALQSRIQHLNRTSSSLSGSPFKLELQTPKPQSAVCIRSLSKRELDVLALVATGYSRKEIGTALAITSNTAAKHVASIYRKLNISSIAEATRIAIENGLVNTQTPYR